MKNLLKKIDVSVLKRAPFIWNTKLHILLPVITLLHLLFWGFGYFSSTAIFDISINKQRSEEVFFDSYLFIAIVLCVIIAVLWLVGYLKNNTFKIFYPNNKLRPFKELCVQVLVFFLLLMIWLPFYYGHKYGITSQFTLEQRESEIEKSNIAFAFIPNNISNYFLSNRCDKPFFDEHYLDYSKVENSNNNRREINHQYSRIDTVSVGQEADLESFVRRYINNNYSLKRSVKDIEDARSKMRKYIPSFISFFSENGNIFARFKKEEVECPVFIKTTEACLRNYSNIFYEKSSGFYYKNDLENNYEDTKNKEAKMICQRVNELLDRNDEVEIKAMMQEFINIINTYNVDHNLTADAWYSKIFTDPLFRINKSNIIKTNDDKDFNLYIQQYDLKRAFNNINRAYTSPFGKGKGVLIFFFSIALAMSLVVFFFRMFGKKTLLYSTIVFGTTTALITLLIFVLDEYSLSDEIIFITVTFISLVFTIQGLSIKEGQNKLISSIRMVMSMLAFPFLLMFIGNIDFIPKQDSASLSYNSIYDQYEDCALFVTFTLIMIFYAICSPLIHKWRALPQCY